MEKCQAVSMTLTDPLIEVSVADQLLILMNRSGETLRQYPISTSERPQSCKENSLGTPWGLHGIADKIGEGEPEGMVFRGRKPTGQRFWELPENERKRNLITTRILRLKGLEPGINQGEGCDSFDRYIYIHGTNHEERLGTPFSGGCIEMKNSDLLDLFPRVPVGALLYIHEPVKNL